MAAGDLRGKASDSAAAWPRRPIRPPVARLGGAATKATAKPRPLHAVNPLQGRARSVTTVRPRLRALSRFLAHPSAPPPTSIKWVSTITADGHDLAFISADVVGSNGLFVRTATNPIAFTVTGPGLIAGIDVRRQARAQRFRREGPHPHPLDGRGRLHPGDRHVGRPERGLRDHRGALKADGGELS